LVLCCLVSTNPGYRLRVAFQNSCHPYCGISVCVMELGTDEMGI